VMRDPEAFARCLNEGPLKLIGRRKGNAVDQGVQGAIALAQRCKKLVDLGVVGYVATKGLSSRKRRDEVLGLLFEALVLIGDRKLRARLLELLGDAPRNAALIRDAENDGRAACQVDHCTLRKRSSIAATLPISLTIPARRRPRRLCAPRDN